MQIKKYETKDRYGNSKSFEFFEGSADMNIPGMTNMPDHPGEPKGTDTVPAWLTPGEFVINKEATDMYGPLLKNINDEGRKMQSGEPHDHPSEAMYAAKGDVVPDTPMSQYEIYQYLISLGFKVNAAKGIMSNIRHEAGSSFDPSTVQKTDEGNPVRYGGMGLFQWEKGNLKRRIKNEDTGVLELKPKGGRFDTDPNNLLKFAKEKNRNWTDPKTQIDFMNWEMRPQADDVAANKWRTWAALRKAMNNAATPGEAAQMFADKYERHKGPQQVSRTTWADDDENFSDPNIYTSSGDVDSTDLLQETYEDLGSSPMKRPRFKPSLRPTELGKSFNLDDAVKKALYKEAGGSIPQYYGIGDEVRDYYRSGIPMPGSVGTMATGSTWDIATEAAEAEQRERERQLEARILERRQLFLGGGLDEVLKTSLEKDNVPELMKELIVPPANSMYEEDELRDYYRDGIPMPGSAGTMSSDSTWDQKTAEEKDMAEFRKEIEGPIKELRRLGDLRKYGGVNEVASNLIEDPQDALENPVNVSEITVDDLPPVKTNTIKSNLIELGLLSPSSNIENFKEAVATGVPPVEDGYKVPEVFNRDDRHMTPSGNYEEWKILNRNAKEAQALRLKGEEMGTSIKTINNFSDQELEKLNDKIVNQKEKVRRAKIREDYAGQLVKEKAKLAALQKNTLMLKKAKIENEIALLQIDKKEALMLGDGPGAEEIQLKIDKTIVESNLSTANDASLTNTKTKITTSEVTNALTSLNNNANVTKEKDKTILTTSLKNEIDNGPLPPLTLQEKAKGMLKSLFGGLFDKEELKRMAILYAGSRLAGGSHEGSLAWSAKDYLKRIDTKEADHKAQVKKYIEDGEFTIKTIKLFDKTKDIGMLLRRGVPVESTGKTVMLYSPQLGKVKGMGRQQAYEHKQGDNTYWSWDQAGQVPVSYSANGITWSKDDAHKVYGTDEHKKAMSDARVIISPIMDDLRNTLDKLPHSEDNKKKGVKEKYITGLKSAKFETEVVLKWANRNGVSSNELPMLLKQAYEIAIQSSQGGKQIGDLTPILNELRIAEKVGVPEAFKYEDKSGVLQYMDPESLQGLTDRIDIAMNGGKLIKQRPTADMYGTQQARSMITATYKVLQQVWADKSKGFDSAGYNTAVASAVENKTTMPNKNDYTNIEDGKEFKTLWTKRAKNKKVSGFFEWASSQTDY